MLLVWKKLVKVDVKMYNFFMVRSCGVVRVMPGTNNHGKRVQNDRVLNNEPSS